MKRLLLSCLVTMILQNNTVLYASSDMPANVFDLKQWKLQIPGPKEFKDLSNYTSEYFSLTKDKEMLFHLDAAEKGTTPNAHYVRSELRHLPNWKTEESHILSGEFKIVSNANPDKVTALQIHGITDTGKDAPPLLRIAINHGDLIAAIKTDSEGKKTDMVVLKNHVNSEYVKVEIQLKNNEIKILVDDQIKLTRSLSFWKFMNYFKAGCYPQATKGLVDIYFRKRHAE